PAKHPGEALKADIRVNGEMVVEYGKRREHVTALTEQAFSNALLNLAHRGDQVIMYVTGHGERKLDGIANDDLGGFGSRLSQLGYHISSLDLAVSPEVPHNASLLVITQPQVEWMPGEVDKLMRYVNQGGNVLWLLDPGPLHGLTPLAEKFGLVLSPGVVIDPDAQLMRAPATWTLGTASSYPITAITRDFDYLTAFPFARALGHEESSPWHYSALVNAAPHGWVSAALPRHNEKLHFDKKVDIPGPVDIALALERTVDDRTQRAVVVGSGSFLANMYAGNGRNLDLGINMVNWLCNQDNLIAVLPKASKDAAITLSLAQLEVIAFGLWLGVPLLLVMAGALVWAHRKR
ncbi:MAG TPA: Gldg family protein, partial [Gallionellaceae bacterium]|nr:Gldg family protein [Gallionellaceae bacterium]